MRWSLRVQSPTCRARRQDYRDRRSPCVCMRHSIHDCASMNARCAPGSAQNVIGTLRTRALKNRASTWPRYKQASVKRTFLNIGLEKIYASTSVLFGIVPAGPPIQPSHLRVSHASPGFRGRPRGWWNSSAVSMQRPCESFRARRYDSSE